MKRILGILSVLLVLAVSVLAVAVADTETVPVYLEVPAFVRITVYDVDGAFNLVFDPAELESTVEDTVALLAEANVSYTVSPSVNPVTGYTDWANLINVTIDDSVTGFGAPGTVTFDTTATLDVFGNINLGTVPANTHIADVVFTISSK
jgi:hypothetical protein